MADPIYILNVNPAPLHRATLSERIMNVTPSTVATALGASTSSIPVNGQKITGAADPTSAQDVATKHYVDGKSAIATPTSVAASSSTGTGSAFARDDHVHAHGNQAGGSLHAAVGASVAGFAPVLSGTDDYVLTEHPIGSPVWRPARYVAKDAIRDYGCVGNGSTDDTSALQTAMNSAAAGGWPLFVPPATYKIASALTVPSGLHIFGKGNLTVIKSTNAGGRLFDVQAGTSRVLIERMALTTTDDASAASSAVFASGVDDIEVSRCLVTNFADYGFRNNAASTRVRILYNNISNIYRGASACGVNPSFLYDSQVEYNTIHEIGDGTAGQWAVYCSGTSHGLSISRNAARNCSGGFKIHPSGTIGRGCLMVGNTSSGMSNQDIVAGNVDSIHVNGNNIRRQAAAYAIRLEGVSHFQCCENAVDNAPSLSAWASTTAYGLSDYVTNGGNVYACIASGTSAGSGGPTGTTRSITDNTVTWRYVGSATASSGSESIGLTGVTNTFGRVAGNVIQSVAGANLLGINADLCTDVAFVGNAIDGAHKSYNFTANALRCSVDGGTVKGDSTSNSVAVTCVAGSTDIRVSRLVAQNTTWLCDLAGIRCAVDSCRQKDGNAVGRVSGGTNNRITNNLLATGVSKTLASDSGTNSIAYGNHADDDTQAPARAVATGVIDVSTSATDSASVPDGSTITNFSGGYVGQVIRVRSEGTSTIKHDVTKIKLQGAVDFSTAADNTLTLCQFDAGVWTETARKT